MTDKTSLIAVNGLKKYFPIHGGILLRRRGWIYAVDDVSFKVNKGETLGLVGESGCGKTTLGRCVIGLYPPTGGEILFNGNSLTSMDAGQLKQMRLAMQMVFQDPFESLNSRHTVREILAEKYIIHNKKDAPMTRRLSGLLDKVGLSKRALDKFPHEFSGGQRQRIGIARAISLDPDLIICDEPVSALDVSVQSQILNLLLGLQKEMGLTYLFISHDLAVVRHISDRIAVMYLGRIVEMAASDAVYQNPRHPYSRALLSAIPLPDPDIRKKRIILKGEVPSPENPPSGCNFHTRCPHATAVCRQSDPPLKPVGPNEKDHVAACHLIGVSL